MAKTIDPTKRTKQGADTKGICPGSMGAKDQQPGFVKGSLKLLLRLHRRSLAKLVSKGAVRLRGSPSYDTSLKAGSQVVRVLASHVETSRVDVWLNLPPCD